MMRRGNARQGLAWSAALFVAAVAVLPASPALAAEEDDASTITVTVPDAADTGGGAVEGEIEDAEFRWGINIEAGSGAFAGGCNFLSAGKAGNAGGAKVWTEADGLYSAASGDVEIVKATAAGSWTRASFATKCLDRNGNAVSVSSLTNHTESQVVISGGVGEVTDEGVDIQWTGSFTAVMYGGMTYWSATDPHLVMDADGDGRITAMLSGYGTSREDMGQWSPISPREVVIAEIRDATLTEKGFAQAPEYLDVVSAVSGQTAKTLENVDHWGAFPASFMQFQELVGQAGYWMTSGGQRDRAKVATTVYVSYDASVPVVVEPETPPSAGGGSVISNPTSQRTLTSGGNIVQASATPAAAAPALPVTQASTVVRDDGSSFIPEARGGLSAYLLPGALTLLSLLVGALSAIHLAGGSVLPWLRRN